MVFHLQSYLLERVLERIFSAFSSSNLLCTLLNASYSDCFHSTFFLLGLRGRLIFKPWLFSLLLFLFLLSRSEEFFWFVWQEKRREKWALKTSEAQVRLRRVRKFQAHYEILKGLRIAITHLNWKYINATGEKENHLADKIT